MTEYKTGTDRHNFLMMKSPGESYPEIIKDCKFWNTVSSLTDPDATGVDIATGLASSGFYCGR